MDIKTKFDQNQLVYFIGCDKQMHCSTITDVKFEATPCGSLISYRLQDPSDEYSTATLPESALHASPEELIAAIKQNFKAAYPAVSEFAVH
jgi:hypothetical protein